MIYKNCKYKKKLFNKFIYLFSYYFILLKKKKIFYSNVKIYYPLQLIKKNFVILNFNKFFFLCKVYTNKLKLINIKMKNYFFKNSYFEINNNFLLNTKYYKKELYYNYIKYLCVFYINFYLFSNLINLVYVKNSFIY